MMTQQQNGSKKIYRLSTGEACLAVTDEEFVAWLRDKEKSYTVTYNNKEYMHLVSLKSIGGETFISDLNEKKFVRSLVTAGIVTVVDDYQ